MTMAQNSYPYQYFHAMARPFDSYTFPACEAPPLDHGLQALLSGHGSRDTSVVYNHPIVNFYHDSNGPWTSMRATSSQKSNASLVPNLDYSSYRDAPASDVSDSGYASQAAASLPIVNLEPTDYNRECGDLPLQVNSFSFTPASASSPAYDVPRNQNPLLCTRCGETAKCPSDFKKHELKHIKPFVCQEPGCPRKEGFTTVNDLNRHKKSVHKIRGLTKSFRCDSDRCKEKNKLWPRLDNFKQHLKRMHKSEDMEDMIQRSMVFGSPAAAASDPLRVPSMDNALAGIDAKTDTLAMSHHDNLADFGPSPDDLKTHDWTHYKDDQSAPSPEDRKPVRSSLSDAPKLRELADAATAASATPKQPKVRDKSKSGASKDDAQMRFLDQMSGVIATSITKNGTANEGLDKAVLRTLLELADNRAVLTSANDNLKDCTDRLPPGSGGARMTDEEVKQSLSANANNLIQKAKGPNRKGVECPFCAKMFNRDCDLNKHIKRHTRPYGCTFPQCRMKFGSKNDWTRHEGKQHSQVEAWRCEYRAAADAAPCAQLFYQQSGFRTHLREQHRIESEKQIDAEVSVRRIGRDGQVRFWCGFCRALIDLTERGCKAWVERWNHIDNAHFKAKQHIKDWVDVQANMTNAEVAAAMDPSTLDDSDVSSSEDAGDNSDQPDDTGPLRAAAEHADAYLFIMTGPKKDATGGTLKNGQKRAREEDGTEVLGQPPQKSRKAETLFFCCGCKQGPFAWSLYQNCIYCQHEFCEGCDRRKHENSAEETVDYNLWSHVVGR